MAKARRKALGSRIAEDLDRFDRAILELVQINNQLTSHEIGDKIGLSPTACQRRLRRLRESGVILADVSLISPAAAGVRLTFVVTVSLEREQINVLDKFKRMFRDMPEVTQCYYVTGQTDFVLIVKTNDIETYSLFTKRAFFDNPDVKHFQTLVVTDSVKFATFLPLL